MLILHKMGFWLRNKPKRRWLVPVLAAFILSMVLMTGFESLKEFLYPRISLRLSHVATIVFVSVMAAGVTYVTLRLYIELMGHAADELSQRLRLNDELGLERMFMRSLMENTPDHIFFKDDAGRYLRVNRAQASAFGVENPADVEGHTDFDFFTAEHATLAQKDEQDLIRTGTPMIGREVREAWPDGRVTWVSSTKVPLRDRRGRIIGTFGISRDITEFKRAEQRIRQLSLAVEQSATVTLITDVEGSIEYVNPSFTQLTGYTLEEVLGKNPRLLKSGRMPPEFFRDLWETIRGGDVWHGEVLNRKKNGDLYWGRASIAPIRDVKGKTTHFVEVLEDVTEQYRAAEALRQSELKHRLLVEQIPAIVYRAEPGMEGRWLYVSPQIRPLLGFTEEEWLGDPAIWARQLAEEDRQRVFEAEKQAVERGLPLSIEYRMRAKDGRAVWFRDLASIVDQADGETRVMQGILLDITEQRRASEESANEVARRRELEHILSLSPVILFLWRNAPGWPVEFVSDNVRQLGYEPDDFTTGAVPYASIVHPDDIVRVGQEVAKYTSEGLTEFTQEYRVFAKNGQVVWTDDRTWIRRDAEGKATHYQGIIIDISARKRAEEIQRGMTTGLRSVLEVADELIGCQDIETLYRRAVELARERLGLERCALFLEEGDKVRGTFGTGMDGSTTDERELLFDKTELWKHRFDARQPHEPRWTVSNEHRMEWTASGTHAVGRGWVAITPMQAESEVRAVFCNDCAISQKPMDPVLQEVVAVYCSMVGNIIARRLSDEERTVSEMRQRETMERADRLNSLGMLAAGMAHEINNPLQGMLSHLHAVHAMLPEAFAGKESLIMVERGIESIAQLVRKLLVLGSSPESGAEMAVAGEAIDFVVQLMESQFKKGSIQITKNIRAPALRLAMPRRELVQVLLNLMLNARDAMPKGGDLTVYCAEGEGSAVISISDTGEGIRPEVLSRIFAPFFTTKGTKGTGLGLSVAASLVRASGGHIDVTTKPGAGSTFTVRCPLAKG